MFIFSNHLHSQRLTRKRQILALADISKQVMAFSSRHVPLSSLQLVHTSDISRSLFLFVFLFLLFRHPISSLHINTQLRQAEVNLHVCFSISLNYSMFPARYKLLRNVASYQTTYWRVTRPKRLQLTYVTGKILAMTLNHLNKIKSRNVIDHSRSGVLNRGTHVL